MGGSAVGVIGGGLHLDLLAARGRGLVAGPPVFPPSFVRSLARPSPAQKIDRGFEVDIDVLRSPHIRPLDRARALLSVGLAPAAPPYLTRRRVSILQVTLGLPKVYFPSFCWIIKS